MNVGDTLELISETKRFLIDDYEYVTRKKSPNTKDLLNHVRDSYKEGDLDELLEEVLLEYDLDNVDEEYKVLLLVAACVSV